MVAPLCWAGDWAGHASQGQLNATSGCTVGPWVTVAGKEPRLGCCWAGLCLRKVVLCLGYSPLPCPPAMGTMHRASSCATAPSQGGGAQGPWSEQRGETQLQLEYSLTSAALFLLPPSRLTSRPCPSVWLQVPALLWVPHWCFGMCMSQLQPWNLQRNVRAEPCSQPEENR